MVRLSELAIFTEQVSEVLAFYQAILGRAPEWQSDNGGQFTAGDAQVLVHRAMPEAEGGPPNESHFAFAVPELDSAVESLRTRGHTIVAGPEEYDWGRSAYLRDPDGRLVELSQA
jgi:predicted enzyme related to lactoylglutathione lyase